MKILGGILVAIGLIGLINGGSAPPGASSAESLGMMIGPFLFGGVGAWLIFQDDKSPKTN